MRRAPVLFAILLTLSPAAAEVRVTWQPAAVRPGDVGIVLVHGVTEPAGLEGEVAGRPLRFFPSTGGVAALVGIDMETSPGRHDWTISVPEAGKAPPALRGTIMVAPRQFTVQHLTLPAAQVDLDPETARRAQAEAERLRALYGSVSPERLWQDRFVVPLAGAGPGEGFGARRVINGKPRSPHSGVDYAAEPGTPVLAANRGRVALVDDFFFPGRLVIVDHGLGLYTLYFHLQRALVTEGALVNRGQPIGEVGASGRATGPHLHWGAQLGPARVDPESLVGLSLP